jgi:predicted RNA-binding protein with PIN domain
LTGSRTLPSEPVEDRSAKPPSLRSEGYERVIVDGLNALGSRPDGWWRDRPRAMGRLVARLAALAAEEPGLAVEVVFDGRPHDGVLEQASASVEIAFAGAGANAADREIAARVRAAKHPAQVLVVSSDRRLAASVKAAGGVCVGAGGFVRQRLGPAQQR